MGITSIAQLLDRMHDYDLLKPAQFRKLAAERDLKTLTELTWFLVDREWLTPYQVNQLFNYPDPELAIGRYRLLQLLGTGGMARVFKAWDTRLQANVVIKVIHKQHLADPVFLHHFSFELQAMGLVNHPNVIRALDAENSNDQHFLVLEYFNGPDLHELVRREGPLPLKQACEFIRQAASGLQHIHECGLIHRDIKPANLLAAPNVRNGVPSYGYSSDCTLSCPPATPYRIKILDLGLARLAEPDDVENILYSEGEFLLGTLDFMAPEQTRNPNSADIRSDLYSLGCTFYYLLTGRVPFPCDVDLQKIKSHQYGTPRPVCQFRPDVPERVVAIIDQLMAKDPYHRYQTPEELLTDLTDLLDVVPLEGETFELSTDFLPTGYVDSYISTTMSVPNAPTAHCS